MPAVVASTFFSNVTVVPVTVRLLPRTTASLKSTVSALILPLSVVLPVASVVSEETPETAPFSVVTPEPFSVRLLPEPVTTAKLKSVPVKVVSAPSVVIPLTVMLPVPILALPFSVREVTSRAPPTAARFATSIVAAPAVRFSDPAVVPLTVSAVKGSFEIKALSALLFSASVNTLVDTLEPDAPTLPAPFRFSVLAVSWPAPVTAPSMVTVPSATSTGALSVVVVADKFSVPAVPPTPLSTEMEPPPMVMVFAAVNLTVPPFPAGPVADASMVPSCWMLAASMTTFPPLAPDASIVPVLALETLLAAFWIVNVKLPPAIVST